MKRIPHKARCWSTHPTRTRQCELPKHLAGDHVSRELSWPMGPVEATYLDGLRRIALLREFPPCFYCGVQTTRPVKQRQGVPLQQPPTTRTDDHLVPRSRGGAAGSGNKVHACQRCNWAKGNLMPSEFHPASFIFE